jgi:broad specificity phosphatase PhoE
MSRVDEHKYNKYKTKYLSLKKDSVSKHNEKFDPNIVQLYLIRHGETDWNKLRITKGRDANEPLNKTGEEQAIKTGIYLKKYRIKDDILDKNNMLCIYASPMKRAKKTAQIIKKQIGFNEDIIFMDNLKERKSGKLSRKKNNDLLKKKFYETTLKDPIEKFIQGDDEKSKINKKYDIGFELDSDLKKRGMYVIKKILESKCRKILIISHGAIMANIIQSIFNISYIPFGDLENGNNCWISLLEYDKSTLKFKMVSPPNTEHLGLI